MEIRQKEESEEMVIGGRVNNKYLYFQRGKDILGEANQTTSVM